MNDTARTVDLSIYHLKRIAGDIESVIPTPGTLLKKAFKLADGTEARLFIRRPKPTLPGWAELFDGYVNPEEFGKAASTAAVLLLDLGEEWYAITFGVAGRHLINRAYVEERFGLLTVLNSIPGDRVRSLDKTALDARGTQSHVQASREASPQEFGLDIERDLVRAVTGTPSDDAFGLRLHGMDALRATLKVTLDDVPKKLREYGRRFRSRRYKKEFSWIDHISPVNDTNLVDTLDKKMLELIHAEDHSRCWIAVPELIDWSQYLRFRYGGRKKNLLHHDISLTSWIEELRQLGDEDFSASDVDLGIIKRTTVRCYNEGNVVLHKWPLYRCVYAEVEHRSHTYLLTSGQWYRIDNNFVDDINEFYGSITLRDPPLPIYWDRSEREYNERICAESEGQWVLMDRNLIRLGNGLSPVEFCDIYTDGREIVHVKRYGQASGLSHLFAQGIVSGELFRTNERFRELLNDKLPDSHKLGSPRKAPEQDEYCVVYAIVSGEEGNQLTLPFFSKLNVRAATMRLRGYGYRVALAKISIDDVVKLTKRYVDE